MRQYLTLPSLLTSCSLSAGFLALLMVYEDHLGAAVALLVAAACFDLLDGPVARATGKTSAFGANLDSLADIVAFGVAPAFALYAATLHRLPVMGAGATLAFALCAAWRLARFPLCKDSHVFVGCPVPVAAMLLLPVVAMEPAPLAALTPVLVLGALMVGRLPFPTLGGVRTALSSAVPADAPVTTILPSAGRETAPPA
jgi:CDP-diacylglycerol--serine O-phosphatidyltransferase